MLPEITNINTDINNMTTYVCVGEYIVATKENFSSDNKQLQVGFIIIQDSILPLRKTMEVQYVKGPTR